MADVLFVIDHRSTCLDWLDESLADRLDEFTIHDFLQSSKFSGNGNQFPAPAPMEVPRFTRTPHANVFYAHDGWNLVRFLLEGLPEKLSAMEKTEWLFFAGGGTVFPRGSDFFRKLLKDRKLFRESIRDLYIEHVPEECAATMHLINRVNNGRRRLYMHPQWFAIRAPWLMKNRETLRALYQNRHKLRNFDVWISQANIHDDYTPERVSGVPVSGPGIFSKEHYTGGVHPNDWREFLVEAMLAAGGDICNLLGVSRTFKRFLYTDSVEKLTLAQKALVQDFDDFSAPKKKLLLASIPPKNAEENIFFTNTESTPDISVPSSLNGNAVKNLVVCVPCAGNKAEDTIGRYLPKFPEVRRENVHIVYFDFNPNAVEFQRALLGGIKEGRDLNAVVHQFVTDDQGSLDYNVYFNTEHVASCIQRDQVSAKLCDLFSGHKDFVKMISTYLREKRLNPAETLVTVHLSNVQEYGPSIARYARQFRLRSHFSLVSGLRSQFPYLHVTGESPFAGWYRERPEESDYDHYVEQIFLNPHAFTIANQHHYFNPNVGAITECSTVFSLPASKGNLPKLVKASQPENYPEYFTEHVRTAGLDREAYFHLGDHFFDPAQWLKECHAVHEAGLFSPHRPSETYFGWKSFAVHGLDFDKTSGAEKYGYSETEAPYRFTPEAREYCPSITDFFEKRFLQEDVLQLRSRGYDLKKCRLARVRIMLLEPGGFILPHNDTSGINYERRGPGAINLAINNPEGCHFYMWHGKDVNALTKPVILPFAPGRALQINVSGAHSVINNGAEKRYHMIIHLIRSD